MKKVILSVLFLSIAYYTTAQTRHEVKLNILNTIALGSVEVGYEYFTDSSQTQSIGVEFLINDRFGFNPQGKNGREFKTNSYALSYNFYFVQDDYDPSSFYISPFLKYRVGDFIELDENSLLRTTDMNSAIIGIGAGYKWVYNGQLALGPYVSIARGFSKEVAERFSAVELNGGFSIGYRF
ncbi:MAG TPA: hypothetical protein VKX33_11845 [Cyclobacteriaceae bacterium]|nr:hypothetical protein [Cyclobacteriaceae bacterium]